MDNKKQPLTDSERLQNGISKINTLLDALKEESSSAICLYGVLSVLGGKRVKKENK
jgi:hypothetical protein